MITHRHSLTAVATRQLKITNPTVQRYQVPKSVVLHPSGMSVSSRSILYSASAILLNRLSTTRSVSADKDPSHHRQSTSTWPSSPVFSGLLPFQCSPPRMHGWRCAEKVNTWMTSSVSSTCIPILISSHKPDLLALQIPRLAHNPTLRSTGQPLFTCADIATDLSDGNVLSPVHQTFLSCCRYRLFVDARLYIV